MMVETYIPELSDPSLTLQEWKEKFELLIAQYGPECRLRFDGGANNVQAILTED